MGYGQGGIDLCPHRCRERRRHGIGEAEVGHATQRPECAVHDACDGGPHVLRGAKDGLRLVRQPGHEGVGQGLHGAIHALRRRLDGAAQEGAQGVGHLDGNRFVHEALAPPSSSSRSRRSPCSRTRQSGTAAAWWPHCRAPRGPRTRRRPPGPWGWS